MKDYLVRGMSMDGFVKAVAIRSTELVRRGAQIQKTTPNATAAFGRCLTAASMMGNMQKVEDGSMTLQVRGGGPIGTITVVSDSVGNVRGCVTEPRVPLVEKYPGKLDVGATVGTDGTLTVIRDLQMKEPYIGSTQLVSGEIGDDVTAYFEYPNGATGVFITTTADAPGTNRLEITGTKATLICQDGKLIMKKLEMDEREWCATCQEGFRAPSYETIEVETDGQNGQHPAVLNAFAAHILRGEPLVADGREGINGLMLSNAIHLSSWLGHPVTLPIDEKLFLEKLNERRATSRAKTGESVFSDTNGTYGSK